MCMSSPNNMISWYRRRLVVGGAVWVGSKGGSKTTYFKHVPLGRIGTVSEVAAFAAFLVSDRNGYMNGETILMDGGL